VLGLSAFFHPESEWELRILLAIAGTVSVLALQFKGIGKRFDALKESSDKNTKRLAVELSNAIGIPVKSAGTDSPAAARIYRIANQANSIDQGLEHLTPGARNSIRIWSDVYLSNVENNIAQFSKKNTKFEGAVGLEAAEKLISNATSSILASMPVTTEALSFWNSLDGKKYRASCMNILNSEPIFKEDPNTLKYAGIARVFTFPDEIIKSVGEGDSDACDIVCKAMEEAILQESSGIAIKMLMQIDLDRGDLGKKELLIVDHCISTRAVTHDPENGKSKTVFINWDKNSVEQITGDWRLLWNRANTIKDFISDTRIEKISTRLEAICGTDQENLRAEQKNTNDIILSDV